MSDYLEGVCVDTKAIDRKIDEWLTMCLLVCLWPLLVIFILSGIMEGLARYGRTRLADDDSHSPQLRAPDLAGGQRHRLVVRAPEGVWVSKR